MRVRLPARLRTRLALVAAVLLVAAGTGVGVGVAIDGGGATTAPATAPPPSPVAPEPLVRPAGAAAPVPTPAGVAAALDPLLDGLGAVSGRVADPADGAVLWDRDPGAALVPGSTVKLVTAAAALLALDPAATLDTTVVTGPEPGTVVLVGGGDPTLAAGGPSVYPGAARLDDLVAQVRASGAPVGRVLVDVGRYAGDGLAPGWFPADVAGGYVAPVVPVMLDGGRADPTAPVSPRSATPAGDAARELARRLGADPALTDVGAAPPGAEVLATVSSPPVEELVATVLATSDNVLAEALAREVARAAGAEPSFAGSAAAVLGVVARAGLAVDGAVLVDGSGLSVQDRVPAALLTDLLVAAAGPDDGGGPGAETARLLRPLLAGLPVAGGSGTLAERYGAEPGAGGAGRGWVRAKTGTLSGVNSLAGTVLDVDGRLLVFAVLSNGPDAGVARPRLDALAATLRGCGCR